MPSLEAGGGPDQDVHPLAGHEAADARHEPWHPAEARTCRRGLCAPIGVERAEALAVDAGRDDRDRQDPSGGPLGLVGRITAGGDHDRRTAEDVGERRAHTGVRPGTVISAPCSTSAVRPLQMRAEHAERKRGIEHDQAGVDVVGQTGRSGARSAGVGSSTF